MRWQRVFDWPTYLVVRILICAVQTLSIEACERASAGLAFLFNRVIRVRRGVIDENLRHAYPNLSAAARRAISHQMWHSLFLMVAEIAHARRKIHPQSWRKHIHFVRDAELVRLLLDDRATVIVSGHFGNFELGGYILGLFGFPTCSIARPLDNRYLDRYLSAFRGATGQSMLPKQGSAGAVALLMEQGGVLTVLGDQAAGHKGCWVEFFGRPASAHKAIALLALSHRCPLVVSYSRRLGRPLFYELGVQALADPAESDYNLTTVPELTQWYSDQLEAIVRVAPEQYWWLHRRWKGRPPARLAGRAA